MAAEIAAPSSERVALGDSLARVLAEGIAADREYPPFPRATRDGYAVRSSELRSLPARLRCVGQIKAGDAFQGDVGVGECVEIMTGAAVPTSMDAVVMVEFTRREGGAVSIERAAVPGENIVPKGAECGRGDVVLTKGTRIRAQEISVAASVGRETVQVFRRPRVAILSTGDEVVEVGQSPNPVQIRNSNAHSLAAQVRRAGAEPIVLSIAPDEKIRLRELVEQGLGTDLLLLSGGVSMGKYDLVEEVLAELNAEFFFTGVKIQPGKPLVFGRAGKTYFFGLPGNPISTMVTFELFARSMVDALSGAQPSPLLFFLAELSSEITTKIGLTRFLPGRLIPTIERPKVSPVPWHGSGDVFAQAKADCLLVVPPDRERIATGELVTVLPL